MTRALACMLALALLLLGPAWLAPQVAFAQPEPYPPEAKDLELADGPNDVIFLRAVADKTKVYVGEQVTLSVYLYYRVQYEMSERNDPPLSGFLRYALLADPTSTTGVMTKVKGERYGARLIERVALVPLRPGQLSTGSLKARFKGRQIGSRVLKESNDVVITAEAPPKDGQPPNFVQGDVGRFQVSATVTPNKTQQGGSIGVIVKVEGSGNIPPSIKPPVVQGVKWLQPKKRENITTTGSKLGGSRTFEYVVRLERAGDVDLGTLELPYFDPETKSYNIAKTPLGVVHVEAQAGYVSEDASAQPVNEPLKGLPSFRKKLGGFTPPQPLVVTMPQFVAGLAAPPFLAFLVMGLARVRARMKARSGTAEVQLRGKMKSAMKDAAKADKANDPRSVCAAIERAVHAALEARTGVKTRALRLDELGKELGSALDPKVAEEAKQVLSQCESLRFMPSVDEAEFEGLRSRAQALTRKLAV